MRSAKPSALETVQPPEQIRAQLAERLRETRLLRRLLRIAEERARQSNGGVK